MIQLKDIINTTLDLMEGDRDLLLYSSLNTYRKVRDIFFPKDFYTTTKMNVWKDMTLEEDGEEFDVDKVLNVIDKSLQMTGGCGIYMKQFEGGHYFLLIKTEKVVESKVNFVRVESYTLEYPPRVVEFNNWKEELRSLLQLEGEVFSKKWSEIFTVSKQEHGFPHIRISTFNRD